MTTLLPRPPGIVNPSADATEHFGEHVREILDEVKPKLRGWLHLGTAPFTLGAGGALVWQSPTPGTRLGSAVFVACALVLFTVSAIYHRGDWSPRAARFLRRFDHANIFLLIAGSHTAFGTLMLDGADEKLLLTVTWGGAAAGIAFRMLWIDAPRWLYTSFYFGSGCVAIYFFGDIAANAERSVLHLMVLGAALYAVGGLVYGTRRPNPHPTWFGFHEVFHSFTIVAFIAHYVGVSIATYSLR